MSAHELLYRLESLIDPPLPSWLSHPSSQTTLTHIPSDNIVAFRPDRPAVMVSSTSWTADEDFSLLIIALDAYQSARSSGRPLQKLVVLITGLGGMRAAFQKIVEQRERGTWTDICVRCVFVPARDYPTLLGCADLGVSLHTSSSGRDLPMKVVDMFGCGVPVLAKEFGCIGELVKDRQNGRVFRTAEELGEMIQVGTLSESRQRLMVRICCQVSRMVSSCESSKRTSRSLRLDPAAAHQRSTKRPRMSGRHGRRTGIG